MDLPKRKPVRLKGYDYSTPGAYFITICTKNRKQYFGEIDVGFGACDKPKMILSPYGIVAEKYIAFMNGKYDNVFVDKYVVMPNHIHLIVVVQNSENSNGALQAPHPTNTVIPKFISLYKRYCNQEYTENIWQTSYHDHIIRGDKDYKEIWEYIENNSLKWQEDEFYIK